MLETVIKKDKNNNTIFSLNTSYEPYNYNEEGKMYLSFHTTKSVSAILSQKELDILINRLVEARNFLEEKNKQKNIK